VIELTHVAHPQALHNGDRPAIRGSGQRHDLIQTLRFEPERGSHQCSLGRVRLAPVRESETPPISTHGVKSASNVCTMRPKPRNGVTSGTSTAHSPEPVSANWDTILSRTNASRRDAGMCSITRRSALSTAKSSRSRCLHSRNSTRSPRNRGQGFRRARPHPLRIRARAYARG